MKSTDLYRQLETLRRAQEALVDGMPHRAVQRREYLNALAAAYESGMLVTAPAHPA